VVLSIVSLLTSLTEDDIDCDIDSSGHGDMVGLASGQSRSGHGRSG